RRECRAASGRADPPAELGVLTERHPGLLPDEEPALVESPGGLERGTPERDIARLVQGAGLANRDRPVPCASARRALRLRKRRTLHEVGSGFQSRLDRAEPARRGEAIVVGERE